MICRVGSDHYGVEMIENFKSFNIDTQFIVKSENQSSGVAPILVSDSGYHNELGVRI